VTRTVAPEAFEPAAHFYPRVLNAQIHPLVRYFLGLGLDRVVARYCHLNPTVDPEVLGELLTRRPRYLRWAGCDLLHVTTEAGQRRMVVVETNSSPSGQKSMPLYEEEQEQGGYRDLLERTFWPMLKGRPREHGDLAVIYDKNEMEASGYAAVMADLAAEPVHLVPFYEDDPDPPARFEDGWLEVRVEGAWRRVRAAFRYVTQRPWTRIPLHSKTRILNPIAACLAGGRNKAVAAKAYDIFNGDLQGTGLQIDLPETIWDVSPREVPLWVRRWGGHAVIKVPYSNAGQGVWTITSAAELEAFQTIPQRYERLIVQGLVGNYSWSSHGRNGRLFHVGTLPNKRGHAFVADLRFMVQATTEGFRPLAIYARRARQPLVPALAPGESSWEILGTNLSVKTPDGWTTETERLMLVDRRDFNPLGLGVDELITGFVQTALATLAIDAMAVSLHDSKGRFRRRLFAELNEDPVLLAELEAINRRT